MYSDDTGVAARTGDLRRSGVFAALVAQPEPLTLTRAEVCASLGPPRRRVPATGNLGACAWCLSLLRPGQGHTQEHRDPSGAAVRLLWCNACTDGDPILQALADNENAPAGCPAAARRFEELHRELHARVLAAAGADGLRAVFHVLRDLPPPNTLRGHGARWALPTSRGLK